MPKNVIVIARCDNLQLRRRRPSEKKIGSVGAEAFTFVRPPRNGSARSEDQFAVTETTGCNVVAIRFTKKNMQRSMHVKLAFRCRWSAPALQKFLRVACHLTHLIHHCANIGRPPRTCTCRCGTVSPPSLPLLITTRNPSSNFKDLATDAAMSNKCPSS